MKENVREVEYCSKFLKDEYEFEMSLGDGSGKIWKDVLVLVNSMGERIDVWKGWVCFLLCKYKNCVLFFNLRKYLVS